MPDLSSRLSAALSDCYRIERELGEGGMALSARCRLERELDHHSVSTLFCNEVES